MPKTVDRSPDPRPWKLLLWTAVLGLLFGVLQIGEIAEDSLRVVRNNFHTHPASGDIVLLAIDDKSLNEVGNWPWPRRKDAELVDRLKAAGAKRVFFDINFSFPSDAVDDQAFAAALQRAGNVTLLTRARSGPVETVKDIVNRPIPEFARYVGLANASVGYNYQNAVWQIQYSDRVGRDVVPTFGSALSGVSGPVGQSFRVDYSIDPDTQKMYSAGDVLSGKVAGRELRDKDVLVGIGTDVIGDSYFIPGYGKSFGINVHAIAAETLKHGRPLDIGWLPAFFVAFAAATSALFRQRIVERAAILGGAALALLVVPAFLEARLVFADITPALFVLSTVSGVLIWRRYRHRGLVNAVSNLPNLNALNANRAGRDQALIAARVLNYEGILATLPPNSERPLVEQIVSRINVGNASRTVYQGDGGIFAWFDDPRQSFGNHLDALHNLFHAPARVGSLSLDLSLAFGVEVGSNRSLSSRLASALVAADEAAHDGLKWKYHDPESFADASWKLSMLSQLDEAIDRGEVWVAFQPKLDVKSRRIVGAEALARWTHPEKGPIAASEFVEAAEQSNRIGKLTDFVLDKAVSAAARINAQREDFDVAVNLSARLLADRGFLLRLSALLARHGLAARHLTLELTETAALAGDGNGIDMIARLREIGVRIAIDDYGTGLSTLDYLKKIPANEIKIDQSFVKGIVDNRSDRLMVQSTIGLVHSLDRVVVAEGVEHANILDCLAELDCDIAQGFAVGRPMSLDSLIKRLAADRKVRVA